MREHFIVDAVGGALGGWVQGEGQPVVLLHGGPGLSYEYLDEVAAHIDDGHRIIAFQQRGLAPSTTAGPFTMEQAIADVVAVIDGLDLDRVILLGHSWGGHLALRCAATHPDRLLGALVVEPIGAVGDGAMAAFEAEMAARTPRRDLERMTELDRRAMAGEGTPEELRESLALAWPAYFADPTHTPPPPEPGISIEAYSGLLSAIGQDTGQLAAALAGIELRYHVIAGAGSPIPWGQAARATADLSPHASLQVLPAAGHFPWFETPGCIRDGLTRLRAEP